MFFLLGYGLTRLAKLMRILVHWVFWLASPCMVTIAAGNYVLHMSRMYTLWVLFSLDI